MSLRLGRILSTALAFVWVWLSSGSAWATTWQAPVGGRAVALDGQVACSVTPQGEWTIEQNGHAVRPPASEDAVGKAVEARVAPTEAACASASATLTLVATGRWPTVDVAASALFVDEGRLELHGRNLRGAIVQWVAHDQAGEDHCSLPQADAAGERCVVATARGLSADPTVIELWRFPPGARTGADVVSFDASGRRVDRDAMAIQPGRIVLTSLIPPGAAIDLAGGGTGRIPLVHPEAVASADCGATSCAVSGSVIVVGGLSTVTTSLAVRIRLAPRVVLQRGETFDPTPVVTIPVLPCGMAVASGDVIRGVDRVRVVVRVDARCAADVGSLRWYSAGRPLDVLTTTSSGGAAFVLLALDRVESDEVVITATHGGADTSSVGQARVATHALPIPHATLVLPGAGPIDYVPTNRAAVVRWARSQDSGQLVLLPVEGVYAVETRGPDTLVRGERGAAGFVALRYAWRVPSLPPPLSTTDLAVIESPLERPLHEASVPVALGARKPGDELVDVLCGAGLDEERVLPGTSAHVRYGERDACRVVFHRERLSPEDGTQHLQLEVEVTRVDGETRPEGHVSETILLQSSDSPRYAWIKHVSGPFDRVTIRVSHVGEQEEPSVQWGIVFGTGHFRLYGTTAIPTGLYRVSDPGGSGILSLNLGVLMRLTWLDSEGHEGFLGLETGVMGEGLANSTSNSGQSNTQIGVVTGIGLSVPIANRSLATETSINLHAWFEYEISRDLGGQPGSPFGFVFGPSISIGNVGTNF